MNISSFLLLSFILFGILFLLIPNVSAQHWGGQNTVELRVMQHLCNAHIKHGADFADLALDKNPYEAHIVTLHSCPTVILPAHKPSEEDAFHDPAEYRFFNYTLVDFARSSRESGQTIEKGQLISRRLCESDIPYDVNGDGQISLCLDASYYSFSNVPHGLVMIRQTQAPGESRYGLVQFSPESSDGKTFIGQDEGVIVLDTSQDDDGIITVHIYNFLGNTSIASIEREKVISIGSDERRAYHGHGWATSAEKSYPVQALWIRDLDTPRTGPGTIAEGSLRMNVGPNAEQFKLVFSNSSRGRVSFTVVSATTAATVGSLALRRAQHSNITLWQGTLMLDQGSYMGDYRVELGTRSVEVEDTEGVEKLIEQRNRFNFSKYSGFFTNLLERMKLSSS